MLALVDWDRVSPRGALHKLIGPCGDWNSEKACLMYQYRLKGLPAGSTILIPPLLSSPPLLQGYTFNIDPPGCTDIDDVFTIGIDDYYYITIADVARWIPYNEESFQVASRLSQTLYSPRGVVLQPLLPGIQQDCSLVANELRFGVSLRFRLVDGQIIDPTFLETRVINDKSTTYEDVRIDIHPEYIHALELVSNAVSGTQSTDPHDWVANLMILYNTEAAKVVKQAGTGLLRHHDAPTAEKLEAYSALGADGRHLAFESAKYVPASENSHHWGLNVLYCHATSPIRRCADIVNQFVLKGQTPPIVDHEALNRRDKDLKKYNRDAFFLDTLQNAGDIRKVAGIAVNDHRIWVPEWKRLITCQHTFQPGTQGIVHYSLDMNGSTWKRKMDFRFSNSSTPES